jgi:hypothetical protein
LEIWRFGDLKNGWVDGWFELDGAVDYKKTEKVIARKFLLEFTALACLDLLMSKANHVELCVPAQT